MDNNTLAKLAFLNTNFFRLPGTKTKPFERFFLLIIKQFLDKLKSGAFEFFVAKTILILIFLKMKSLFNDNYIH